jgi:hypothetical protein
MFSVNELERHWTELHNLHMNSITICQETSFDLLLQQQANRHKFIVNTHSDSKYIKVFVADRLHQCKPIESKFATWVNINLLEFLSDSHSENDAHTIPILLFTGGDIHTIDLFNAINEFKKSNPNFILVAWDTDNHHALHVSMFTAYISDYYFPSHVDNLYILSRFNPYLTHEKSACCQFPLDLINKHIDHIFNCTRTNAVRGLHAYYSIFPYRNRVINSLYGKHPEIKLVETNIGNESHEKYFIDFISHKVHFVAPTLNDASNRIYEIYTTGGIPIIPISLRGAFNEFEDIHENNIHFYDLNDVIESDRMFYAAIEKFDSHGKIGVQERLAIGLQNHGSVRLKSMLSKILASLKLSFPI